jgi:hypothetical protein
MIIEFTERAIELSPNASVSPKMKLAAFAILLVAVDVRTSDPVFPTAEGTTWKYELRQERQSNSLDLTEPAEEEHLAVTYRLGGVAKIDNVELRRLEIYRDDALEHVDLIAIDDRSIICPARLGADGKVTKLVPPQQMLALPLKTGTKWNFDGTIGETKVEQHYEMAGEENVDLPAGKFHAWRIHCEQIAPAKATIDRWFVPGTGFVKVETAVKGESGGTLQKSTLLLSEPPKVTAAPHTASPIPVEKFSAGVSMQANDDSKTEFKSDVPAIFARWHGHDLPDQAQIRATFVAESVADVSADYGIDEITATSPKSDSGGTFTLTKPDEGWAPGNYRIEFFVNDKPATTLRFKISK